MARTQTLHQNPVGTGRYKMDTVFLQVSEGILLNILRYLVRGSQESFVRKLAYLRRPDLDSTFWRTLVEQEVHKSIPKRARPLEIPYRVQYESMRALEEDKTFSKVDLLLPKTLLVDLGEDMVSWLDNSPVAQSLIKLVRKRGIQASKLMHLVLTKGTIRTLVYFIDRAGLDPYDIYLHIDGSLDGVPYDSSIQESNLPPLRNLEAFLELCHKTFKRLDREASNINRIFHSVRWTIKDIGHIEILLKYSKHLTGRLRWGVIDLLLETVDIEVYKYVLNRIDRNMLKRVLTSCFDFVGHYNENRYRNKESYQITHFEIFKYLILNYESYIAIGSLGAEIEYSEEALRFLAAEGTINLLNLEEQFYFRQDFATGVYLLNEIVRSNYESVEDYLRMRFDYVAEKWESDDQLQGVAYEVLLPYMSFDQVKALIDSSTRTPDPYTFLYAVIKEGTPEMAKEAMKVFDDFDTFDTDKDTYEDYYQKIRRGTPVVGL